MSESLLLVTLKQILGASETVIQRFKSVPDIDYFIDSEEGQLLMDSICMQLIAIGESLKKVDKLTEKKLLHKYPQVDWKAAKGIRDIISHHYFDLDAEAIYDVCENDIEVLKQAIEQMISDYS